MQLTIDSFPKGGTIPRQYALGIPDPESHVTFGKNRNPHLRWSGAPDGTRSFAVICHDTDAPTEATDVNQEGRTVPLDLPRADFYHWVLVDIPPTISEIPEGAVSSQVTPKGKPVGPTEYGVAGKNDYTGWFEGNDDMEGVYGGYDGMGPPWNDERFHHYHFTVYALDVANLGVSGEFSAQDALAAMEGHVLAKDSWSGRYAIYDGAREP